MTVRLMSDGELRRLEVLRDLDRQRLMTEATASSWGLNAVGCSTVEGQNGNGYLRRLLVNRALSVLADKRGKSHPWQIKLLVGKKHSGRPRSPIRWHASSGW